MEWEICMKKNKRVIILGGRSFVASYLIKLFKKEKKLFLPIYKKNIDLTKTNSINKLSHIISKDDLIVFISAIAPVKNFEMLNKNLEICSNVFKILKKKKISYLLYVSSDAVYSDSNKLIDENSNTNPDNLHGFMHLMRENMLKLLNTKLCIVRPTLVYGSNDPHDGYGPNKFLRLAQSKKKIKLFGRGEEKRDHIHVNDVGHAIYTLIQRKYVGTVNIVSGNVVSFFDIAKKIKNLYKIKISFVKRNGPMPHNGYRAFNNGLLKKILQKTRKITNLVEWIEKKEKYKKL